MLKISLRETWNALALAAEFITGHTAIDWSPRLSRRLYFSMGAMFVKMVVLHIDNYQHLFNIRALAAKLTRAKLRRSLLNFSCPVFLDLSRRWRGKRGWWGWWWWRRGSGGCWRRWRASKNMCVTSIYLKKISYFFIYLLNLSLKKWKIILSI